MKTRVGALCLLVAALATGDANGQSVAGTYTWEIATSMRRDNNGDTAGEMAEVKLTIETRGDSILGTYAMTPKGRTVPVRNVRGTWKDNTITFKFESQATLNMNGEQRQVQTTQVFNATIEGDAIKGTITTQVPDNSFSAPVRNFAGKRAKA